MPGIHVLVLGSRVHDDQPALLLRSRLQRAVPIIQRLAREDEHARVVVSGRGEAAVMAAWLISHGVPAGRIIEEPQATSTNENLENAQRLLPATRRWLAVTSDFHAPRTRMWAWHLGIPVTVIPAVSPQEARRRNHLLELLKFPYSLTRVWWRRLLDRLRGPRG